MNLKVNKIIFSMFVLMAGILAGPLISRGADAPKEPTVEDCVERTGLSEEKCVEMIEKFKNMKPEDRTGMKPHGPPSGSAGENGQPPMGRSGEKSKGELNEAFDIETQIEKAEEMKNSKEEKFSEMTEKLERIVEYLKSKSIDTSEAENSITTLKEKISVVLSACDAHIAALKDSRDSNDGKPTDAVREARDKIRELSDDLRGFFRDTLLANLRSLIETITE